MLPVLAYCSPLMGTAPIKIQIWDIYIQVLCFHFKGRGTIHAIYPTLQKLIKTIEFTFYMLRLIGSFWHRRAQN